MLFCSPAGLNCPRFLLPVSLFPLCCSASFSFFAFFSPFPSLLVFGDFLPREIWVSAPPCLSLFLVPKRHRVLEGDLRVGSQPHLPTPLVSVGISKSGRGGLHLPQALPRHSRCLISGRLLCVSRFPALPVQMEDTSCPGALRAALSPREEDANLPVQPPLTREPGAI